MLLSCLKFHFQFFCFQIVWNIKGFTSGNDLTDLSLPTTKTVFFTEGQRTEYIRFNITADDIPELEKVYGIVLTEVNNGGDIDQQRKSLNFTVK